MKKSLAILNRRFSSLAIIFLMLFSISSCNKWQDYLPGEVPSEPKFLPGIWTVGNIASNAIAFRPFILDPLLADSRGFELSEPTMAWVTSHAKGVVNLYNINFPTRGILNSVQIPSPNGHTGGKPAAVVINDRTSSFKLSNNLPAKIIVGSTDGIISGWNEAAGNVAFLIKNNSSTAVYTGLAIGQHHGQPFLYAANFRSGKIEVYDKSFHLVHSKKFIDPLLPKGFAPFNVRLFEDHLIITYAKPATNGEGIEEVGNGVINVFSLDGVHIKRFATKGVLNSPWGIAILPANFFPEIGEPVVLIGNHGDGKFLGFSTNGKFLGELKDNRDQSLVLDGLWGLSFEVPGQNAAPASVYFSAAIGFSGDVRGLFGHLIRQ